MVIQACNVAIFVPSAQATVVEELTSDILVIKYKKNISEYQQGRKTVS